MARWFIAAALLTGLTLAAALVLGLGVPEVFREEIPVHWDIHMQPDHFVPRAGFLPYLLIFPGVMAFFVVLMWLLPYLSPRNFEVDRFADTWGFVMTVLVGFFAYLFALQVWTAIQENPWFDRLFVAGFFALFGLLGNVMGKVQRNFWMGVRTPWTLASEAVWVRTHRIAAWLWVVTGLVGALLVLVGIPFWLAFVGLLGALLWPAVYSLILYKRLQREGRV